MLLSQPEKFHRKYVCEVGKSLNNLYFFVKEEAITSCEMISLCEMLDFGEVIWLRSVGTIQGSHQLDHDSVLLQKLSPGSCLLHYIPMICYGIVLKRCLRLISVAGALMPLHDHTGLSAVGKGVFACVDCMPVTALETTGVSLCHLYP